MNVLKKTILVVLIGVLTSCSSDDDSAANTLQSIIGDWEVISFIVDGEEVIEPQEICFDKYFITEETARYLEYAPLNGECDALFDDLDQYPVLPYTYDGSSFVFDDITFQIIEVTENRIVWSYMIEDNGVTTTDVETLRRIQ